MSLTKGQSLKKQQNINDKEKKKNKKNKNSMISSLLQFLPSKQVSTATKKLYDYVKKRPILNQNKQQQLLPKINSLQYIYDLPSKFNQCQQQIAQRLQTFRESLVNNQDYQISQQLVGIQTTKCYRNVPKQYFDEQFSEKSLNKLLSDNQQRSRDNIFALMDYHDEVQFNVNQQVTHKMRVFINFTDCLNSIQQLVNMSIDKVQVTRLKNNIIKDLIVLKSKNISKLRRKQQKITIMKAYLENLNKMKSIESKLVQNAQIQTRVKLHSLHTQYCQLHEQLKKYCCNKMICKYWDVNYYVQKAYQQCFMKSLKSYLVQVIVYPKQILKNIFITNPHQYLSVPCNNIVTSIDQSFEIQDNIILTVKQNIQKDIVAIFKQGMRKCCYATEQLNSDIKIAMTQMSQCFYTDIYQTITSKSTNILNNNNIPKVKQKVALELQKINLNKYVDTFVLLSDNILIMVERSLSVINRLLMTASELKQDQPQRFQVINAYLTQIMFVFFQFTNETLGKYLKIRSIKEHQVDLSKKILESCKQWKQLVLGCNKKYPFVKFQQTSDLIIDILKYRSNLVKKNYDSMHFNIMNIDLKKALEQDTYQSITINPQIANTIGYILDGVIYRKQLRIKQKNMLSSSLLLDKKFSELSDSSTFDQNKFSGLQNQFFIYQSHIVINGKQFRLVQSTQFVLDFISKYLQNYDENIHLREQIRQKFIEFIMIYINHLRQLILNSKILTLPNKRIKGKTINAKHLCITYAQLNLLKAICQKWGKRIQMPQDIVSMLTQNIKKIMNDINNKFNKILQMRMFQVLQKVQNHQISPEISMQIINNIITTIDIIKQIILDKSVLHQFTGGYQWRKKFLQIIGKNRSPLVNFVKDLRNYADYLPDLQQQINKVRK